MKKTLTSLIFIISFIAYGLYQAFAFGSSSPINYVADNTSQSQPVDPNENKVILPPKMIAHAPTKVATPIVVAKPKGKYNDGTYTGSVADAYYGNVQVEATVSNGKLASVAFLQYPNDRNTSVRINSRAMPALKSEAIQAQSANVNTVSGASDTSGAFRESLASALTKAKV